MNPCLLGSLAIWLLLAGCSPATPPEADSPQKPRATSTDRTHLRRAVNNIQFFLSDLEGRLRISHPQTWALEASNARNTLGNIQLEMSVLRQCMDDLGSLDSLLSALDENLRGATADNWNPKASIAQQNVGSLQLELQKIITRINTN